MLKINGDMCNIFGLQTFSRANFLLSILDNERHNLRRHNFRLHT